MTAIAFLFREMERRGLRVHAELPFDSYPFTYKVQALKGATPVWSDDWEDQAGDMADAIREMDWVFQWSIYGVRHAKVPYFEWLVCNKCDEAQMLDRKNGAPSANKPCRMTYECKGRMRRLPTSVLDIVIKPPPKQKSQKKPRDPSQPPRKRGTVGYPEEVRAEAIRLYDTGKFTFSEISSALQDKFSLPRKVAMSSIHLWVNTRT